LKSKNEKKRSDWPKGAGTTAFAEFPGVKMRSKEMIGQKEQE
jgi:hypothetical protein